MNIYAKESLFDKLKDNTYPGRGIVLGVTPDGKHSVAAYFIMGRSANSRNRVFSPEPDGIRTEAHDPSKLEDPSLIIYHPVRQMGRGLIVTNGDQTDTIRDFLEKGLPMEQALRTREFEPDGPNWTPRISGLLSPDGSCRMSILKSVGTKAARAACARPLNIPMCPAWDGSSTPMCVTETPSPPSRVSRSGWKCWTTWMLSPTNCGRA